MFKKIFGIKIKKNKELNINNSKFKEHQKSESLNSNINRKKNSQFEILIDKQIIIVILQIQNSNIQIKNPFTK